MKSKAILIFLFAGIIFTSVWWWQRAHSVSKHPAGEPDVPRGKRATGMLIEAPSQGMPSSSHVIQILARPTEIPDLATIKKLAVDDEPALLGAYRKTTNMQDRHAATWSLAYIGGDATLAAFKHTMIEEFAGRNLTGGPNREPTEDEMFLINLVWAIGVMAQQNDKAFELLKLGTDPWYWQKNVKWQSAFDADIYGILATRSMQAIGMSGRKEVPEILNVLSKQPLGNEADPQPLRRNLNGGVADGAFYYSIIRDEGREGFLQWLLTVKGHDPDDRFSKWSATAEGIKWHQWYEECRKVNLEKRRERLKQAFPKSSP